MVGEVWQITEMAALVPLTSKYSTRNHIRYNKPVKVLLAHMYYGKILHAGMASRLIIALSFALATLASGPRSYAIFPIVHLLWYFS